MSSLFSSHESRESRESRERAVRGWQAELRLSFQREGERSALALREHRGPLRVQRPFYPEGDAVSHVVLLHPPGGIVGGDELAIDVRVGPGAHALLTTPAATKFYRSAGARALQTQVLHVAAGARLEWLPQETILWSGARARVSTRVELAPDARFIGWEVSCLGRPAAGETFVTGELEQRIELVRAGVPLLIERASYAGGGASLNAAWGLRGHPVIATLVCASATLDVATLELTRAALTGAQLTSQALVSASLLRPDLLVARYLGDSVEAARSCFSRVWQALRPSVFGRPASPPRIWLT